MHEDEDIMFLEAGLAVRNIRIYSMSENTRLLECYAQRRDGEAKGRLLMNQNCFHGRSFCSRRIIMSTHLVNMHYSCPK
jgi:hypothetical protein